MMRSTFADKIEAYLGGELTTNELYNWSRSYIDTDFDDPALRATWGCMHQLHEINPDYRTTDEELEYLLKCLKGGEKFTKEALQQARDIGMEKRFDASPRKRKN